MKAKKIGIIGKKLGMTQLYDEKGVLCGATIVDFADMEILGYRELEKDGYNAVILGYSFKEIKNKKGTHKKPRFVKEIRVDDVSSYEDGSFVDSLKSLSLVDVSSNMKGRGFAGVIKRYGFGGGPAAHGSKTHRRVGSIGNASYPSRVMKGKKMPGHYGNTKVTILNQQILRVDPEKKLLFIKGSIPGAKQSYVVVRDAIKG